MTKYKYSVAVIFCLLCIHSKSVMADTFRIETFMTENSRLEMEFSDGSERYVAVIQRAGISQGGGLLANTKVTEIGLHDFVPTVSADAVLYHEFKTPGGDSVYIKSTIRGIALPGSDDKTRINLNGLWEIVGASGQLRSLRGSGIVNVKTLSSNVRHFTFEGNISVPASTKVKTR